MVNPVTARLSSSPGDRREPALEFGGNASGLLNRTIRGRLVVRTGFYGSIER
jgi:hypothetical protein